MGDMNTFTCEGKDLVESKRLKIQKMEGLLMVKGSRKGGRGWEAENVS